MKTKLLRPIALLLIVTLLLGSCGGPGASAATMRLAKTEGAVSVSDSDGKEVAIAEDLGLYSGYGITTERNGYAWIDLDSVKLTKMDRSSQIEITKDGKNLEIEVLSGNLFFNITEPLAGDETLNIRTSSMLVGIRGTCGWVEVPDDGSLCVYLLEGKVECTAGENTATISAGEMAALSPDGTIQTDAFTAVPGFVWAEVRDDEALANAVLEMTGIDLTSANPLSAYAEVLGDTSGIVYTEELDFDGDGSTELLVITIDDRPSNRDDGSIHRNDGCTVYRNGPDGPQRLFHGGGNTQSNGEIYSLVESGGRLFIRRHNEPSTGSYQPGGYYDEYFGSVIQSDGSEKGGCVDWIQVISASASYSTFEYGIQDETGLIRDRTQYNWSQDQGELEALQGKYTHVRDLIRFEGVG